MCGRYVSPDDAALERLWRIHRQNWRLPRAVYNVAPTTIVPIIQVDVEGEYSLEGARWGLVPHWWKQDKLPGMTFNARSEEAAQKPTWRDALKHSRCLMPALGWYEWNENEQVRNAAGKPVNRPYFYHAKNDEVLLIAGLRSLWTAPNGSHILTCSLLSKEASVNLSHIHHRMPVVLSLENSHKWLDAHINADEVQDIVADSRTDFEAFAVDTSVNNTRNDYPELLKRAADRFGGNE
jgi:putative SOS response-associated peptidase YedK